MSERERERERDRERASERERERSDCSDEGQQGNLERGWRKKEGR